MPTAAAPQPSRHRHPQASHRPAARPHRLPAATTTIPARRSVRARGPGRVNLIGEHTDYNGGLALPFAIDRGVTVTAEPLSGDRVEVVAFDLAETDEFPLADPGRTDGWRAFVRGTVAELTAAGIELAPARLVIEADVPRGSGLSSSAALEAALCLALLGVAGAREPDRVELAKLCSRVENDWVGAETGLLDQLASLLGEEGSALRIDFKTLDLETVPLELGGWQLVTADSGAAHSHAEGGYNERRAECRARRRRSASSTSATPTRRRPGASAGPRASARATC